MSSKTYQSQAMRASIVTVILNLALSIYKLAAGIVGNSAALVSDAVHSASDVLSTFIVMIGIKIAGKESDDEHQFGHERFESVAAIILSTLLLATGVAIGYKGVKSLVSGDIAENVFPGIAAIVAAAVSIVVKEGMYWYTRGVAKRINSGALMADAWHHRTDALSSVGSFLGVLFARMGFLSADSIACVVICLFIIKAAYDIFMDAINKMTDTACDEKTQGEIREIILAQEGVLGIDILKTRLFGDKMYIEVEISANGESTLRESHEVAQRVHDEIENNFTSVKHCMVHVNPATLPEVSP